MSENTEATPTELPTNYLEWRTKLTRRLADHMAALLTYEKTEKEKTIYEDYAIRREKTNSARSKLQGVSRRIYDWSSLTEDSKRILFAEIDKALEDAEKEVTRVLQRTG